MMNTPSLRPHLASLIRHVATCLGGYLIARGHAELGGLVTALGAAWGVQQKRVSARKRVEQLRDAAGRASVLKP